MDDVKTEVEAALALDGRRDLELLVDLTKAPSIAESSVGDRSLLAHLYAAIRRADACFAASDPEGARRALDEPMVWAVRERQSLARLTEAYLAMEPATSRDRLRKLATLGTFLDEVDEKRATLHHDLRMPEAWDGPRITEIAVRARAWLDERGVAQAAIDSGPLQPGVLSRTQ